jgi:hypothetical protein
VYIQDIFEGMKISPSLWRLLKKWGSCFDRLSMNGQSSIISRLAPFVLSLSKGERRVFKHSLGEGEKGSV